MNNQKLNNLLKDPRTNWKYILIVVILGFLAAAGILGYYYLWMKELEAKLIKFEINLLEKTAAPSAEEKFDLEKIAKVVSFYDSKGNLKKIIVYNIWPEDRYEDWKTILYLTDENLSRASAVEVTEISPWSDIGESPYISPNYLGTKNIVVELLGPGDVQEIVIADENGRLITSHLYHDNVSALGLGTKIPGMYGLHFDQWESGTANFSVNIFTGDGSEFKVLFDASTGKLIGEVQKLNWKIYTNTEYSYSIKYPPDYRIGSCHYCDDLSSAPLVTLTPPETTGYGRVMIYNLKDKQPNQTIDEYLEEISGTDANPVVEGTKKRLQFNGIEALVTVTTSFGYEHKHIFFLNNKNQGFYITFSGIDSSSKNLPIEELKNFTIFEKMLSTFRFLE